MLNNSDLRHGQEFDCERSQNTVLLASTQAVYKAPHSTVRGEKERRGEEGEKTARSQADDK